MICLLYSENPVVLNCKYSSLCNCTLHWSDHDGSMPDFGTVWGLTMYNLL